MDLSDLSAIDVQQILRVLRTERDRLTGMEVTLTERLRTAGNGDENRLVREVGMVKAEIDALSNVIAKLWAIIASVKH
jgi:hypothetical protein